MKMSRNYGKTVTFNIPSKIINFLFCLKLARFLVTQEVGRQENGGQL